ncbi:hypothetical protein HanHA300_Chr09g0316331 [Helianthus annuus]|nr:hypothetical protein HanHA300_Chr09g0316331 [Helianthus annuus]KAJ0542219.1 hypothetical protein HanHA89_Chr09g0337371 [Helianthus annuus]KAJ0707268.1 hypothetical protein HanLR1_Chr09g0316601 [Helianthus annuus]
MVSDIGTGLKFTKPVYFRYRFCTGIHRFLPSIPVVYQYRPVSNRTILGIFGTPLLRISVTVFSVPVGTDLIKSCSNAAIQVIAPFKLLFIHTVSKLYFV